MANYNFNVGTTAGGSGNITTFTQGDTTTLNVGTQGANWTLGLGRGSDAFITSWTGGSGTTGTWNSTPSGGGVATLNSNGTGFKVPIANSASYALGGTITLFKNGVSHFTVTIGRVKDTTTAGVSATINYSNATIAIGSTFAVTVSGNASNGSYSYNQNGGATNNRFTPAPTSYAVTGSAPGNQFTATAIEPAGGLNSNGAATGFYNVKAGPLGGSGTTLDTGPNKVIYKPVVSPTPSIALTTNNQVDGSWEVTLSESGGTTNGGSSTQFRFLNGSSVELQGWSTDNTYSNIGSTRPVSVKGQIREVGVYNTSTSAETGLVSVPTIAPDTVFSVSGPSTITSGAGSFTVNISGASQNDEIRVVLNGTNTQLVGFTTVPASGALSLSCTASSANFPSGTPVSVSCQVRRPGSAGGNDNVTGGIGAFNVTRQAAPDGNIVVDYTDGNGTNINATGFYNSANGSVTATISSGSSGTQYRLATTSGSASPSGTVINGINFGTRTGNGAITISVQFGTQGSQIQGDQVGYRVQYREINTSTWFNATGTRATFTLTHTVANSQVPIVFGLGNTAATDSVTVQEAFSNPPPTDCIVEFNQAGGAFTVASGSPRVVTGYSQNRGTTVAYSSRFRNSTTGVVSFFTPNVNNYSLGYLSGFDNSITVTPSSYTVNSTSAGATTDLTFSYTGGSANTEYRLVSTSVAGTIDTDSGASGSFLVDYSNNELPPDGATYTYTFEGRRSAATGGDPSGAYQAAAAGTASVSIQRLNLIAPDRDITVNGIAPASPVTTSAFTDTLTGNTFSANAQTTDTISIAGAQIGDEIRVIKDSNSSLLVDFFEITATSFNISVPTSTSAFVAGTSELVKVQIRRPNSNNGDNSNNNALSYTYSRNLNQATARVLTSSGTGDIAFGSTSTIGATAYIAAGNGSTPGDTAMDLVVSSGSASGTDYRIKVTSGTTNAGSGPGTGFTPITNATTSFTTFLGETRLPNRTESVGYIIEARDNSATGDKDWYECYRTISGSFAGTQFTASFTVTRSDYVAPDTVISTSNSFTPTGSSPPYIISSGSTSETVSWTGGSTGTEYFMQTGDPSGIFPDLGVPPEFGNTTGSTSGTITITESSGFSGLPESTASPTTFTDAFFTLYGRVPISANGSGQRTQIEQWNVRRDVIDTIIIVNSVPANKFTIPSQGSFTIAISSANSNTDYRVVLVSQTGTNLTVGSAYGTRNGNGNITLTGTPAQGEFATYKIQARAAGSSDPWTDTTGSNSTFTAGRYEPASFEGSSGGSITDVPINSSVATATVALSGLVGTAKVYVSVNTGNATVKVIKNTNAPVTATNASPVDAVNGDVIGLEFTVGGGYSETSTATISIDQPINTTLQFGPVFSITTEASPGGSTGGGGGAGNYGLEVRDSSGDIILTNSDLVGDFCYPDTVSIASGGTTGISGVNAKGGNTVLIQENLNPFTDNQRAEAVLENSGKQVRINLVGATASQALTFNVLVFST